MAIGGSYPSKGKCRGSVAAVAAVERPEGLQAGSALLTASAESTGLLHHGGRLREAAQRYSIPLSDWMDLSTGINPAGWPVPEPPEHCWARLPEDDDGLEQAARAYYDAEHILPTAGSQAAIQALPRLRPPSRVAVLDPGYCEHAAAWRRAGHSVLPVAAGDIQQTIEHCDVLLLTHPNNPTGATFAVEELLAWQARLARRDGWLLLDEAYMDLTPEYSLCRHSERRGLIVLRSLGKFFGLAGARVGFVCAHMDLLIALRTLLGPWSVSAPARWVATAALRDQRWQTHARRALQLQGERLQQLLDRHGLTPAGGTALFQWLRTPRAAELHRALATQGILTRLFEMPASLRFGLPGDQADWSRLDAALGALSSMGVEA